MRVFKRRLAMMGMGISAVLGVVLLPYGLAHAGQYYPPVNYSNPPNYNYNYNYNVNQNRNINYGVNYYPMQYQIPCPTYYNSYSYMPYQSYMHQIPFYYGMMGYY